MPRGLRKNRNEQDATPSQAVVWPFVPALFPVKSKHRTSKQQPVAGKGSPPGTSVTRTCSCRSRSAMRATLSSESPFLRLSSNLTHAVSRAKAMTTRGPKFPAATACARQGQSGRENPTEQIRAPPAHPFSHYTPCLARLARALPDDPILHMSPARRPRTPYRAPPLVLHARAPDISLRRLLHASPPHPACCLTPRRPLPSGRATICFTTRVQVRPPSRHLNLFRPARVRALNENPTTEVFGTKKQYACAVIAALEHAQQAAGRCFVHTAVQATTSCGNTS